VRNERRMLGSGRGYGKPVVERPHGARSLLYSLTYVALAKNVKVGQKNWFAPILLRL